MRKTTHVFAGIVLALVGVVAVFVGVGLMMAPAGEGFGLTLDLLRNTPFTNYFIPGVLVLFIFGLLYFIGAFIAFKNYRFAGVTTTLLGLFMVAFVAGKGYWIEAVGGVQLLFLMAGLIATGLGVMMMVEHKHIRHGRIKRYLRPV